MTEENLLEDITEDMTEDSEQETPQSGVILNFQQVQSIDIPQKFSHVNTENGWTINILGSGRVVVNFITSMRKLETPLMSGDSIERYDDNIVIVRNQPIEAYRTQRGTTSLARTRDELLSTESSVGRKAVPD